MKKIIAIILSICCVFAFASCDKGEVQTDGIAEFVTMYAMSEPTKVVTTHTTEIGNVTLAGNSTLATGTLNDGSVATVLTYRYEILQSVEYGATNVITPIMGEPETGSREYVEGKGERIDGGGWNADGYNFAPTAGSIAINLNSEIIKNPVYSVNGDVHTLSFTLESENVAAVLGDGYEIPDDASVVITANGAVITGITISYTSPIESEYEDIVYPDAEIVISTVYTYDIEEITLVKQ